MTHELLIIATAEGDIQAIDARDGSSHWARNLAHPFGGPVLVQVEDMVIAVALDGYLCAVAVADGTVRWEGVLATEVTPAPLADVAHRADPLFGLRVAASRECCAVQFGNRIFGIDPTNGHITWETAPRFHPVTRWWLLAVGQEHVYVLQLEGGRRERAFVTAAFSTWDGAPQWWARDLSAVEPPWDGAASLAEADEVVYVYSPQGLHALEAKTGMALWTCNSVPRHHIGALTVGQDQVVVASQGHLGAYRRDTGALLWSASNEQQLDGSFDIFDNPLILGDVVYVGHRQTPPGEFHVEAYHLETGTHKWVWPGMSAPSDILHPDISWRFHGAGTTLYLPSLDTLWGIHSLNGSERWHLAYRLGFSALLAIAVEEGESAEA